MRGFFPFHFNWLGSLDHPSSTLNSCSTIFLPATTANAHTMVAPDTPGKVVQSLAQHLDDIGNGKPALRRVWQTHLRYWEPLSATATNADLENFLTVSAWYLTPKYLLKQQLTARDIEIINSSRRITAIDHLTKVWGATAIATVCSICADHGSTLTFLRYAKVCLIRFRCQAYQTATFSKSLSVLRPSVTSSVHSCKIFRRSLRAGFRSGVHWIPVMKTLKGSPVFNSSTSKHFTKTATCHGFSRVVDLTIQSNTLRNGRRREPTRK